MRISNGTDGANLRLRSRAEFCAWISTPHVCQQMKRSFEAHLVPMIHDAKVRHFLWEVPNVHHSLIYQDTVNRTNRRPYWPLRHHQTEERSIDTADDLPDQDLKGVAALRLLAARLIL